MTYPPPQPYPAYAPPPSRPIGVTILAILVVLVGVLILIAAIAVFLLSGFLALTGLPTFGLAVTVIGVLVLILALIWIGVGMGLWHLRSWAWWLALIVMLFTIVGSIASPPLAVVPILIFVYLILVRHHFR